jgi:hypothetical protein
MGNWYAKFETKVQCEEDTLLDPIAILNEIPGFTQLLDCKNGCRSVIIRGGILREIYARHGNVLEVMNYLLFEGGDVDIIIRKAHDHPQVVLEHMLMLKKTGLWTFECFGESYDKDEQTKTTDEQTKTTDKQTKTTDEFSYGWNRCTFNKEIHFDVYFGSRASTIARLLNDIDYTVNGLSVKLSYEPSLYLDEPLNLDEPSLNLDEPSLNRDPSISYNLKYLVDVQEKRLIPADGNFDHKKLYRAIRLYGFGYRMSKSMANDLITHLKTNNPIIFKLRGNSFSFKNFDEFKTAVNVLSV